MNGGLVLVTGGAGFIGANVVERLIGAGRDVAVCDSLGEAALGKWRNLVGQPIAELVTPGQLEAWLGSRTGGLEAIVHMGAISSTTEPDVDKILAVNFGLSKRLWDWCAVNRARFLWASSAATYGDGSTGFDDDPDPATLARLKPLNPYGWSKALFDLYATRSAGRGFAPPQWVGMKFFNVYGPREAHKGAMKSVAAQIWPDVAAGRPVRLFKSYRAEVPDGGQKRDFVHVADAADVVAWLIENVGVSGLFNLGTGMARTFEDLARAVFTAAGREPAIDYVEMPEAIRPRYQYFTEARMERLRAAGYVRPFRRLEAGIAEYVGWLRVGEAG